MKEEPTTSWLKVAVAVLVGLIPISLVLPYLLESIKFPIQPLNNITSCMTPVLIAAFVFALMNAVRVGWRAQKMRLTREEFNKTEFWKIAAGFAFAISLAFVGGVFTHLVESSARIEVREFITSLSGNEIVYMDGQLTKNPVAVVDAIEKVRWMPGHRSHDINRIDVRIVDGDKSMNIFIGRDSQEPREYWVYCPQLTSSSKMDIGRIYTDVFDDFKVKQDF